MADDAQDAVLQQRAALEVAEQHRTLPWPRPSSWDAARWEYDLGLLIDAERERDAALMAQIDQTAHVRDWQLGWEQRMAGEIDGDVAWLQRLDAQHSNPITIGAIRVTYKTQRRAEATLN